MKTQEMVQLLKKPFESIKSIFEVYTNELQIETNQPDSYYLNYATDFEETEPVFFAAVQMRGESVYVYFGALNDHPELLKSLPKGLYSFLNPGGSFSFKKIASQQIEDLLIVVGMCRQKQLESHQQLAFAG